MHALPMIRHNGGDAKSRIGNWLPPPSRTAVASSGAPNRKPPSPLMLTTGVSGRATLTPRCVFGRTDMNQQAGLG